MKKILLTSLFSLYLFSINAQCTIDPFIQQNYEVDAAILALREIRSNSSDIDYDNPIVPSARLMPYLEKLSAIYNNPQNSQEIDSLFNEFQFHVNPTYGYADYTEYKSLAFSVPTSTSWVQNFKNTGVSGITELDNLMSQYQFSIVQFYDFSSGDTSFILTTAFEYLNIRALLDDFVNVPNITYAEPYNTYADPLGLNYSGVPYNIISYDFFGNPQNNSVAVCDIYINSNGKYIFALYGGDFCLTGCTASEFRFLTVSNDCSTVTYSRTLSTVATELVNISIYPNPTSGKLQIQGINNIKQLEIYSILGTAINIPLDVSQNTFNVSSLKNGVYFLKVIDDQNRSITRKFVKQ